MSCDYLLPGNFLDIERWVKYFLSLKGQYRGGQIILFFFFSKRVNTNTLTELCASYNLSTGNRGWAGKECDMKEVICYNKNTIIEVSIHKIKLPILRK